LILAAVFGPQATPPTTTIFLFFSMCHLCPSLFGFDPLKFSVGNTEDGVSRYTASTSRPPRLTMNQMRQDGLCRQWIFGSGHARQSSQK
jgi:hypothetical protein